MTVEDMNPMFGVSGTEEFGREPVEKDSFGGEPSAAEPSGAKSVEPLHLDRIEVQPDRIVCLVRIAPGYPRNVTATLAAQALQVYPTLAAHTCVNDIGPTFGDVIFQTSVPHLLEHVIIEEQTRDPQVPATADIKGATEWIDEAGGLARVQVSFTDDLIGLSALRKAADFVNAALQAEGSDVVS